MKNTGICRRAPDSSAVLMATAACARGRVGASANAPIAGAPKIAAAIESNNLIESFQSVAAPKNIGSRQYRDYTQGYLQTSFNFLLASSNSKSLAGLAKNKGSGNGVLL